MSAQLLEIKDKGADSLILFGRPADVTLVIQQMNDLASSSRRIETPAWWRRRRSTICRRQRLTAAKAIGGMIRRHPPTPRSWIGPSACRRIQDTGDNFTVSYYDTVYMLKSDHRKIGCDKPAIRDALAATQGWKGMLIDYQADAQGRSRPHATASTATRAKLRNSPDRSRKTGS